MELNGDEDPGLEDPGIGEDEGELEEIEEQPEARNRAGRFQIPYPRADY